MLRTIIDTIRGLPLVVKVVLLVLLLVTGLLVLRHFHVIYYDCPKTDPGCGPQH
ncbi:MAG TPA: hypothetical protein VF469_14180 [Kofleriaceae bacterium]